MEVLADEPLITGLCKEVKVLTRELVAAPAQGNEVCLVVFENFGVSGARNVHLTIRISFRSSNNRHDVDFV